MVEQQEDRVVGEQRDLAVTDDLEKVHVGGGLAAFERPDNEFRDKRGNVVLVFQCSPPIAEAHS